MPEFLRISFRSQVAGSSKGGRFWAWTPAPGDHYRDSFFVRARWPVRPEDVLKVDCDEDGVGGDDAGDALRYLVATRARTISQRKLSGV